MSNENVIDAAESRDARPTWGRSRFGGGALGLWVPAILIGAAASGALSWAGAYLIERENPQLFFFIFLACSLPIMTVMGWAIMVDRSTIRGAARNPEGSIESIWLDRAQSRAFSDLMIAIGLTTGVSAFMDIEMQISTVGLALIILMIVDVAVRYLLLKRAG